MPDECLPGQHCQGGSQDKAEKQQHGGWKQQPTPAARQDRPGEKRLEKKTPGAVLARQ